MVAMASDRTRYCVAFCAWRMTVWMMGCSGGQSFWEFQQQLGTKNLVGIQYINDYYQHKNALFTASRG